jgi:RNA polymerase sigma-70 factor (ECF subfamily)
LKRRDERAFTEFVGRYQREVFGVVARIVGDRQEAEDVSQEVFVTVFKKIDGFRGDASLRTWLLKIARNHARSRLRFRKRRKYRAHDSWDDVEPGSRTELNRLARPDERAVAEELEFAARRAFLTLSADAREVLTLRDLNGLKYDEIADILELPVGTVRSRLFRARKEWRAAIESLRERGDESPDDNEEQG